jgi:hypothetical protein
MPTSRLRRSPKVLALAASAVTFASWALSVTLVQRWQAAGSSVAAIRGEAALQGRLSDVLLRLGNLTVGIEDSALRSSLREVPKDAPRAELQRGIRTLATTTARLHNETSIVLSYARWAADLPWRLGLDEELGREIQKLAKELEQNHATANGAIFEFEGKKRQILEGKNATLATLSDEDAGKTLALIAGYHATLKQCAEQASRLGTSIENAVSSAIAAMEHDAQVQGALASLVESVATVGLAIASVLGLAAAWVEMRSDQS